MLYDRMHTSYNLYPLSQRDQMIRRELLHYEKSQNEKERYILHGVEP